MGAYVYRLKSPKAYDIMSLDGKQEKVYHLVFWYKPYYSMWEPEPKWMKPIKMFKGRLKQLFKDVEVKYVRSIFERPDGTINRGETIFRWHKNWLCVTDEPNWGNMKRVTPDIIFTSSSIDENVQLVDAMYNNLTEQEVLT
jgi:hypothetical protein